MGMQVTVGIEKNVYGGDGLARLKDGRVVFVPGAFGGETARVELVEQRRNFVRGRLVELLEASPDRQVAGRRVPGMVYADVSYARELRIKEEQLGNFLERVGLSFLRIGVFSAVHANYRNKVTYHLARRADGSWALGYRGEKSHDVVDVTDDPLALPEINRELPRIRASVFSLLSNGSANVRRAAARADKVTVRHTAADGVQWWIDDPPSDRTFTERTDGEAFEVPAGGFYQVNPATGDLLVKAVREAYLAGAGETPNVLDLYCGVGTFGLRCAGAALAAGAEPRLVGVESVRGAVACAKRNAERLGVKARFFCERVGAGLPRMTAGPRHAVIADPPRGGFEPGVAEWLARSEAGRIFCVSCDPATLARDLAPLVKRRRVVSVKLFDLFPRTARFETVVELERA